MTTDNRTNEPTEAQVEAAAKAVREVDARAGLIADVDLPVYRARAALVAAQGAARPVNSFDTTAERVKTGAESSHVLDPEKVAEVLCRAIHSTRFQYRAMQNPCDECSNGYRALCEAYKEGKLTK